MTELEEKVERIEKVLLITWKLAKAVKRSQNKLRRTINGNVEIFDDRTIRNASNIDKMVITLQELVGDAAEYDKEHPEQKINQDSKMMFL